MADGEASDALRSDKNLKAGPAWVAVDWGTTHLRLWLMGTDQEILDHRTSDRGMGSLQRHEFEPLLRDLLADAMPGSGSLPVVCCGMVGARQGWAEAPYVACPCSPSAIDRAVEIEAANGRLSVFILPGVKQLDPPDVMRGEETQIAGLLAHSPDFSGAVCLPGTHSKWANIEGGRIETFRTFMTGELFALLSGQSILRHSVGGEELDEAAFSRAVTDALENPATLTGELFSIRAATLLSDCAPPVSRARLSGLLIGAEIAGARAFWADQETIVIGESALSKAYLNALSIAEAEARTMPGDGLTLSGLTAAFRNLKI
ncbi:2-dehydro-3-deoxygalactonokinase [Fulvimarina sp. MAC3]|uniref:2-dehydro-3-deoxygalactonokinase n=1 Tax=Fulvimarina sp. MAC3 TaxID=3148887 RepID=UPI0031FE1DDB